MPKHAGGSPKARNLGAELRKAREDAHISARELAHILGIARSRLQRWEAGTSVPGAEDVASYLAHLGINHGAERDRLVDLARDVDDGNWITSQVPGTASELTTLIEFERTCTSMVNVAPLLIPGLLQTSDYVREVMTDLDPGEMETRVMLRNWRQEILTKRRGAPHLTAFIGEGVLREPIGGPEVMTDQLNHLLKVSEQNNVDLYVLRSGARHVHVGHAGPFILFRFPRASSIVHLEHYRSSGFLYSTRDVGDYERSEGILRDAAVSAEDSRRLIVEISTEMEKGSAP